MNSFLMTALVAGTLATSLPSRAQTYTHEFILEDGSAIECALTIMGPTSSQSECTRISFETRMKAKERYADAMGNLNACADLAEQTRRFGSRYVSSVLQACLGRDPFSRKSLQPGGKIYKINCRGEETAEPVAWNYQRGLKDCPGLVEIALEGRLPYRVDQ